MLQRTEVSKYCWKNVSGRLVYTGLSEGFSLQKNTVSAKYNKMKQNKMRHACSAVRNIGIIISPQDYDFKPLA